MHLLGLGVLAFITLSGKIIGAKGFSQGSRRSLAFLQTSLRMSSNIKFTSYNVLSSHLSGENHFTSCKPMHLKAEYRLETLKAKLEKEVSDGAIISLQEVSHNWAGVLHAFFAARGYHMVTGLYGGKFNGYMGVAVAVPTAKYDIVDVDITRVADTKRVARKPKPGFVQNIFNTFSKFFTRLGVQMGIIQPFFDFWDNVTYRTNQMLCLRLKDKDGGKPFVMGTYHMPCMFKKPAVMVTHCALSAQHIQKFAKNDPFVYVGDFNIKPDSSMYALLTEGTIDKKHPDYPEIEEGDSWEPTVTPMGSAYVTKTGSEPDFTNYARVQSDPVFIETLDYIFHSEGWTVDAVETLPHRTEIEGPLPNEEEPSDHILISARMSVK